MISDNLFFLNRSLDVDIFDFASFFDRVSLGTGSEKKTYVMFKRIFVVEQKFLDKKKGDAVEKHRLYLKV